MIEPTGKMKAVLEAVDEAGEQYGEALRGHLEGGTSAEWLAAVLTEAGYPIGATTIKSFRRKLRESDLEGSVKL